MGNQESPDRLASSQQVHDLLETNSEWTNIQDIIKMTFKGIYHTLKVQNECIRDIEQILPAKANANDIRTEMHQQLQLKANLNDMKKTMAEVAANIESRTTFHDVKRLLEQKIERSEVQYMVQQKVTFEEMKNYVE